MDKNQAGRFVQGRENATQACPYLGPSSPLLGGTDAECRLVKVTVFGEEDACSVVLERFTVRKTPRLISDQSFLKSRKG